MTTAPPAWGRAHAYFGDALTRAIIRPEPFHHVDVFDALPSSLLEAVVAEQEDREHVEGGWTTWENEHERKRQGNAPLWGPASRRLAEILASPEVCAALGERFGVPDVSCEFDGGGWHVIHAGGFLDVHADYNRSAATGLHRRLNLLVYLNHGWRADDGGHLVLCNPDGSEHHRLRPDWNRTVVFATSRTSFHGHPEPLPGPRVRRSFAAYYFSPEPAPGADPEPHSTIFA